MIPRRINMGDNYMCLTACLHPEKCFQKVEESVLKDEKFFYGKYFT